MVTKFVVLTVFDVCPDCGAKEGDYHSYGCDNEICAQHSCQLLSCDHGKPQKRLRFNSQEEIMFRLGIVRKARNSAIKEPLRRTNRMKKTDVTMTITVTTVIVDFRKCPSRIIGLKTVPQIVLIPLCKARILKKEYEDYVENHYLNNIKRRIRFLVDHFILWPAYVIKGWSMGYAEGAKWILKRETVR